MSYGTGPPLLVVPGVNDPLLPAGSRAWFDGVLSGYCYRQARACAAAGVPRTVWYVSRPAASGAATAAAMADGYRAVLDELGPVDLLGVSMGGFVALELARGDDRVRSVTLALAAARLSRHGRESLETWDAWARGGQWAKVYRAGLAAVTSGWWSRLTAPAIRPFERLRDHPTEAFRRSLAVATRFDAMPWLSELSVPSLVVGGTADPFFTTTAFATTADALGGRYERLNGWGHDVLIDDGRRVDEPIARFLSRCESA
ncbi:alpha/beta fold hydrolase [Halosegnis longus]|uniref:alpha/beta fold hydrolase n=1 Tax=Halosegnis longus TaxID=2216012 RepID=UPI0013565A76|nr:MULTISPECIES: alpha/beta hydrolase [Halobacteriales]